MKRTRRRLTTDEMEQALAFKLTFAGQPCAIHDDPLDCERPLQSAHIISKQTLRRRGLFDYVYDTRNGLSACYKAHRRSDSGLERFPVERIPDSAWEFAAELELTHIIEKLYGERVAA